MKIKQNIINNLIVYYSKESECVKPNWVRNNLNLYDDVDELIYINETKYSQDSNLFNVYYSLAIFYEKNLHYKGLL